MNLYSEVGFKQRGGLYEDVFEAKNYKFEKYNHTIVSKRLPLTPGCRHGSDISSGYSTWVYHCTHQISAKIIYIVHEIVCRIVHEIVRVDSIRSKF